jgi:hypothetical protein
LGAFRLGWFNLGQVGCTVGETYFVLDFILHTTYTVDACALTSILPPLFLLDKVHFTAGTEATPESVLGFSVNFLLIWILFLHNVVERVRNRTARFRCVFGSINGYGF